MSQPDYPRLNKLRALAERDRILVSEDILRIVAVSQYSDQSLEPVLHYLVSQASRLGVELTAEFVHYEVIERGSVWKQWDQ